MSMDSPAFNTLPTPRWVWRGCGRGPGDPQGDGTLSNEVHGLLPWLFMLDAEKSGRLGIHETRWHWVLESCKGWERVGGGVFCNLYLQLVHYSHTHTHTHTFMQLQKLLIWLFLEGGHERTSLTPLGEDTCLSYLGVLYTKWIQSKNNMKAKISLELIIRSYCVLKSWY